MARTEHQSATEQAEKVRAQVRDIWSSEPPRTRQALPEWAAEVAARRAESDPVVNDATRALETAHTDRKAMRQRHRQERMALLVTEYGPDHARTQQLGMRTINPRRNAEGARARAALIWAEANKLRSLPVNEAARRVETNRTEQEQEQRRRAAERARQVGDPFQPDPRREDPNRQGPTRGL